MSTPSRIVAVLTMALTIGANTAAFAVVEAFLFASVGVPDADRLLAIEPVRELPGRGDVAFADNYPNCQRLRDTQTSFVAVTCVRQGSIGWDDRGEVRPLQYAGVTPEFFATMGLSPVLGRGFAPSEEGPHAAAVVVIGHALWQTAFAGDPAAVGASLRLAGVPHTVIGVMPRGFALPAPTDVWLPYEIPESWSRSTRLLALFGRLAPDVSRAAAQSEMAAFTQRAIEADAAANREFRYRLRPLREVMLNGADRTVLLVQAGALVLLLLAISNLGSLFISWAMQRRHETAIRRALGASVGHIVALFLMRALTVMGLAGVLGYLAAWQTLPLIQSLNPSPTVGFLLSRAQLHQGALLMTVLLTIVGTLLAGAMPAWHAWRHDPASGLNTVSRGGGLSRGAVRWQRAIVLGQSALAVVILFAAVLSGLSFRNLLHVPTGFDDRERLVVRLFLPEPPYGTHAERTAFADALLDAIAREPGVGAAGFATTLPIGDVPWGGRFFAESASGEILSEPLVFNYRRVSAGYLEALGLPLLAGRTFDRRDRDDGMPVAIVSRAAADRLWPGDEAVGKRLRRAMPGSADTVTMQVVGVVANTVDAGYSGPAGETVYLPFAQVSGDRMSLVIHPRGGPDTALTGVRRALKSVDPALAMFNVTSMAALTRDANAMPQLQMTLLALFGLIAVGITALGSYGVMNQLVANRQRELAVRLAVGATPSGLLLRVLGQNARLSLIGVAIGLGGAWLVGGLLAPVVFGIGPRSWTVLAAVAAATLVTTVVATLMPAWRAAHVDVKHLA